MPDCCPTGPEASSLAGRTILVVDDNHLVRRGLEAALAMCGARTLSAASGEEALVLHRESDDRIDAVLLDNRLSGMTGLQTLKALRRSNPKLPAVICSGIFAPNMAETANVAYLQKPFNPSELTTLLHCLWNDEPAG